MSHRSTLRRISVGACSFSQSFMLCQFSSLSLLLHHRLLQSARFHEFPFGRFEVYISGQVAFFTIFVGSKQISNNRCFMKTGLPEKFGVLMMIEWHPVSCSRYPQHEYPYQGTCEQQGKVFVGDVCFREGAMSCLTRREMSDKLG